MANPVSARTVKKLLEDAGVRVKTYSGWETHNRNHMGAWGGVNGVMLHHTGAYSSLSQIVELCRKGYSGLPGPLGHGVIDKSGVVHLIGWGRANHAGLGDDEVLAAVIREDKTLPADNEANTDGNTRFYGFECINRGDGKEAWPEAQLEAMARVSAAICRHHGWNEYSVIGHSEWQPGKIDPRGPGFGSMDAMRRRVADVLRPPKKPAPKPAPKPKPAPLTLEQRVARIEARLTAAGIK